MKLTKQEVAELYLSGKTLQQVADIAGCRFENIRSHLNRLNIKRRPRTEASRKYYLNEQYFNSIYTEDQAYILGFLYADGYNQESKNQIRITLHKKDIDILYKIKTSLGSSRPLKFYREKYADLSINSAQVSSDLALLGCIQKKSLVLTFPHDKISEDLVRHFIRGYFDGDGCISIAKSYQLNLVGTYAFLASVQNILVKECGISKTMFSQRNKKTEVYTMQYNGKTNCKKILHYLYNNAAISLDRKNNLYARILSQ